MGIVLLPVLIGLIFIGHFFAKKANNYLSTYLEDVNNKKLIAFLFLLRLSIFIFLAYISFNMLDANFPSGANGFENNKSFFLFVLSPIIFGFSIIFSKTLSLIIVLKLMVKKWK